MRRDSGAASAVSGDLRPPQGAVCALAREGECNLKTIKAKNIGGAAFFACVGGSNSYVWTCPNRTCLWSCVGWRVSGQEAGEPPEKQTGSRRRTGELRLHGGSRLKATTDRAFSSLSALQRSAYRRGLSFLPGVRNGVSHSNRRPLERLDGFSPSELTASTAQHPIVWFRMSRNRTVPMALAHLQLASPTRECGRLPLILRSLVVPARKKCAPFEGMPR